MAKATKETNCRNCDAPLAGKRFCEECGADSQAKQFSRGQESAGAEENARLRKENEELRKKAAKVPEHDDTDDIG